LPIKEGKMLKKSLVCYLVLALFVIGIVPRVEAAFAPSGVLSLSAEARSGDVEKIRTALENKLVSQRLLDLGYTSEEVMTRVSQLSDSQLHSFAQKLDDLKVGGDGLGIIIAVLVIVVLVLLILQLTGHKVFVK
jgi:hypothetical protein